MPPSQLKRLKASLRQGGVTGPQKSKKEKKRNAQNGIKTSARISRNAALEDIREQFNPFEFKTSARKDKYDFFNAGKPRSAILGRPGVSKGMGEEVRRKQLLVEMQQRGKVGGLVDRRFGEDDPTMTPEERALERFVKEKQASMGANSGRKKRGLFDLEDEVGDDDDPEGTGLTHLGRSLDLEGGVKDDYEGSAADESDADAEGHRRGGKRMRFTEHGEEILEDGAAGDDAVPGRPKSKHEVMKEVMAKSKLHKYERQKNKEDDDDLRAELDAELGDIYALMQGKPVPPKPITAPKEITMDPDRAALLEGKDRDEADREYDMRMRQMREELRAKPTSRTKTDEEIAEDEAKKLKELEEKRLRRMRGEEDESRDEEPRMNGAGTDEEVDDKEDDFGLGQGVQIASTKKELDVEDEDEFVLDDDLIASDSNASAASSPLDSDQEGSGGADEEDEDDAEFVHGLVTAADTGREGLTVPRSNRTTNGDSSKGLASTYACPQSHKELLDITHDVSGMELITIVQRIRALYHPKLDGKNKEKLAAFSAALLDHLVYLANQKPMVSFQVLEQLIRHIHSLAKTYSTEISEAIRIHLTAIGKERPLGLIRGDLVLFTAIGSIFSTSDHFHQIATPAMICMARYLAQKIPQTLGDLARGAFVCTLFLDYQQLSKRYVPEVVNYVLHAFSILAPKKAVQAFGYNPTPAIPPKLRIGKAKVSLDFGSRKSSFNDIDFASPPESAEGEEVKYSLLSTFLRLTDAMASLWTSSLAFIEIFTPFHNALTFYLSSPCTPHLLPSANKALKTQLTRLTTLLNQARLNRRPLQLHNHRPLPIKTSIPKFEESYRPDKKSFDPDRERAELAKLRKEHKRERKGALRELRKDANFVARENLREKKERDQAYEKKYKRLVAEIQGEEGRQANEYEREKKGRKGRK